MSKAFVYTEVQVVLPFAEYPWRSANPELRAQPGFRNKTWLSGLNTHSTGGLYEFDTVANARAFATRYFPGIVRRRRTGLTTRIFDGGPVATASRELNSLHFGGTPGVEPGAFAYTEMQRGGPFEELPWQALNQSLKSLPGLLHLTWLSGVQASSIGTFAAFDTLENAARFVSDDFPAEMLALGAAFTTRLFDAGPTVEASRDIGCPFFPKEAAE